MFETYGKEVEHVRALDNVSNTVWTIITGDEDSMYYVAGYHFVNRLGYIITEEPWITGIEEVLIDD